MKHERGQKTDPQYEAIFLLDSRLRFRTVHQVDSHSHKG